MPSSFGPIFLFSLPRSGSTLLQRMLAKHPDIATAAEPWVLLPLMSTLRSEGIYTNYDQNAVQEAVRDFYAGFETGRKGFQQELREFVTRLYQHRSHEGAKYFLDKTPRYHLIADEILELFPEGKFVFLWRNPLSIISSMLDTWHRGHWYLYFFKIDLYTGLERLIEAHAKNSSRVFSLNYESLLSAPEHQCKELCTYLDIPYIEAMVEGFQTVELEGEMGDPTGVAAYSSISHQPIDKWKHSLRNPLRKSWCSAYLRWLGAERLEYIGYEAPQLERELRSIPFSFEHLGGDAIRLLYGACYQFFELRLIQDKLKRIRQWERVHPHL